MTKREARDLENSRQFMAELVNEFISNAELEMLNIDFVAGSIAIQKRENVRKAGFDTAVKNGE